MKQASSGDFPLSDTILKHRPFWFTFYVFASSCLELTKSRRTGPPVAGFRRRPEAMFLSGGVWAVFWAPSSESSCVPGPGQPALRSAAGPLQATSIGIITADIIHEPGANQEKVVPPREPDPRAHPPQPVTIPHAKTVKRPDFEKDWHLLIAPRAVVRPYVGPGSGLSMSIERSVGMTNGADILVECLSHFGVRHLFGMPVLYL